MSYDCSCDYEPAIFYKARRTKAARKEHRCEECRRRIEPGESYERVYGMWERGHVDTFSTCKLCLELREWAIISVPCFCWAHGSLHDDIREMVEEVRRDVPGFVFEWGRRMVRINRARKAQAVRT